MERISEKDRRQRERGREVKAFSEEKSRLPEMHVSHCHVGDLNYINHADETVGCWYLTDLTLVLGSGRHIGLPCS